MILNNLFFLDINNKYIYINNKYIYIYIND